MAQSKLPAKCSECGLVGPARKKAAKEGWVRRHGREPDWLCPEHGRIWSRARTKQLQEEYARRPVFRLPHVPPLRGRW